MMQTMCSCIPLWSLTHSAMLGPPQRGAGAVRMVFQQPQTLPVGLFHHVLTTPMAGEQQRLNSVFLSGSFKCLRLQIVF